MLPGRPYSFDFAAAVVVAAAEAAYVVAVGLIQAVRAQVTMFGPAEGGVGGGDYSGCVAAAVAVAAVVSASLDSNDHNLRWKGGLLFAIAAVPLQHG